MNFIAGAEAEKYGAHTIGIRPEHVAITDASGPWSGTVAVSEHLGSDTFLHVHRADGDETMTVRAEGEVNYGHGDTVHLTPRVEHIHKFDANGMRVS
jgi:multiple sugar transport system ATP-binding protein